MTVVVDGSSFERSKREKDVKDRKHQTRGHLTQWALGDTDVRSLLLTSSRARPDAPIDQFSDWDVIVVVGDEQQFANKESWIDRLGTPMVLFRTTQQVDGVEVPARLVLYEDGTKIDFAIWPVAVLQRITDRHRLPDELNAGYEVMVDKDQLASGLEPPNYKAYVPTKPTADQYRDLVEEFWWETTYVAKGLARDELFPAKYSFESVIKFELLRRMLEWHIEVKNNWSVRLGVQGRGLKRLLGPNLWNEAESTFVGPSIAENWDALFRTVELFRKLAIGVARELRYEYPRDLDSTVANYLRSLRNPRSTRSQVRSGSARAIGATTRSARRGERRR